MSQVCYNLSTELHWCYFLNLDRLYNVATLLQEKGFDLDSSPWYDWSPLFTLDHSREDIFKRDFLLFSETVMEVRSWEYIINDRSLGCSLSLLLGGYLLTHLLATKARSSLICHVLLPLLSQNQSFFLKQDNETTSIWRRLLTARIELWHEFSCVPQKGALELKKLTERELREQVSLNLITLFINQVLAWEWCAEEKKPFKAFLPHLLKCATPEHSGKIMEWYFLILKGMKEILQKEDVQKWEENMCLHMLNVTGKYENTEPHSTGPSDETVTSYMSHWTYLFLLRHSIADWRQYYRKTHLVIC